MKKPKNEPFQPSVHYTTGYRSGSIDAMGYALEVATGCKSLEVANKIKSEAVRRYGDDFRAEMRKRGIEL